MSGKKRHFGLEDYLGHIEEAAGLASSYVRGMGKEAFLEDRRTQQAVIYNILIIGEAATRIINDYPEFVEKRPDIPWREMRGIRNRLAHGYYDLDLDIVWNTVTAYLDELRAKVAKAMGEKQF